MLLSATMKPWIFVLGSSGHTKVVIDVIEQEGRYRIAGVLDPHRSIGERFFGIEVVGQESELPDLLTRFPDAEVLVTIGDNTVRKRVMDSVEALPVPVPFATVVHPSAQIGREVELGAGTVVMASTTINPGTHVGRGVIVNTGANVDHDCDYVSIAPGATLGGNVKVGSRGVVSLGASVKHGISIGANTVVGAGAVVLKDVPDNLVAYGVPAATIRTRKEGERYL